MHPVGKILDFVGGTIGRMAGMGIAIGLFMVLVGMPPGEFVKDFIEEPPAWLDTIWFRTGLVVIGLAIFWASLRYNVWSQRQKAIDDLAEELSWAIGDLLNRQPSPGSNAEIAAWENDYRDWCDKVSKKLENRAFFTRADQLHFDRLGFVERTAMSGHARFDWLLGQLRLKFDRLRDVINWTQQRQR